MNTELQRVAEIGRGVEVEQEALGILLAGDSVAPVPALDGYVWADPTHQAAYAAIRRLRAERRPSPPGAVHALMPNGLPSYRDSGGVRYLVALAERADFTGEPFEASQLELLAERGRRLQLRDLACELLELADNPSLSAADALAKLWPSLEALRAAGDVRPKTYRQLVREKGPALRVPPVVYRTGIPALDEVMQGGMWPGKLYAIAARMKHGKSLILGTVAHQLARDGVPTLYLTLEMGPEAVTDRMAAADLGTNAMAFLTRRDPTLPGMVERYAETAPECLLFEDRAGVTFAELKSIASRYVRRRGVKVIVLDYWQLVQGQERGETEAGHLGRVAQWMADYARVEGIAILTAAQVNREGQTRGGDGLRLACSMYLRQHKIEREGGTFEEVWLEMEDTRYTPRADIGSEQQPKLYIDRVGPRIAQYGAAP